MRDHKSFLGNSPGFTWLPLAMTLVVVAILISGAPVVHAAAEEMEAGQLKMAVVDEEALTLLDLRDLFERRHGGHGALFVGEPIIRMVLDRAVEDLLLIQEGQRMGLPEEPALSQAAAVYRDLVMLEALEKRTIQDAAEPSSKAVKRAYAHLSKQVRMHLIETRKESEAAQALERLQSGESFDQVARDLSIHASRLRGGDLGWVGWGRLDPEIEEVALKTPAGRTGGPITSGGRYQIIQVAEERELEPPPLPQVEDNIRAVLRTRRRRELRAELLASIRQVHPPEEDTEKISSLLAETTDAGGSADLQDDAVLLKTETGLELTAGRIRKRAAKSRLSTAAAWRDAVEDALLIDEARRRIDMDAVMERKVKRFVDERVRSEMERIMLRRKLDVEEGDVKKYYEENREKFRRPASYHLRHILMAGRDEAAEVRKALQAGAGFAALAREKSIDEATAPKGGDLGWVEHSKSNLNGAAAERTFSLEAGQITEVLEVGEGFAVVQIEDIRPGQVPPLEEIRREVTSALLQAKKQEIREAFLKQLRDHAEIEIIEESLERAVALQKKAVHEKMAAPSTQPMREEENR